MAPTGYTAYAGTAATLLVDLQTLDKSAASPAADADFDVLVQSDATSVDVYASDLTTKITDLLDDSEAAVTSAPATNGFIKRFYAPDDYDDGGVWIDTGTEIGWVNLPPLGVASSGGGSGTVTSVDNISPDGSGNVDLGLATVATSGDYSDLSSTPSLATVATSGDAGDLSNLRSAVVSDFAGIVVMYFYDNGWPTVPDVIKSNTQISKHFVGGDTANQPPTVSGNRIWDRPVA